MVPQEIIARKRDGEALSQAEITYFVKGLGDGLFKDYQASALLMAIFLKGMNRQEIGWLTEAMMRSGEIIRLDTIDRPKVDKHSTGGVGDKVSLILGPLVVAAGICLPMISGRGLGHSGGTLDKLTSIPGFRVDLTVEEYRRQLSRINQAMIGQTETLAPADRLLYALRDVTGTVESIPLICSSIMSKKLAEGTDSLVLDVKFGSGAFMKTYDQARELADSLVALGQVMEKPTVAVLTCMEQPLGHSVGNALEIIEAIDCLRGRGPADLMEIVYFLSAQMLILGGIAGSTDEGRVVLQEKIHSGEALARFRELIRAQGGDPLVLEDYARLPSAEHTCEVLYQGQERGNVHRVDAMRIGLAAMHLGAGRTSVDATIDPAVGISDLVKIGDSVEPGSPLCRLHLNDRSRLAHSREMVQSAVVVGLEEVVKPQLIRDVLAGC